MSHAALSPFPGRDTRIRYQVVSVSMLMAILLYLDRFCVGFAATYIKEDLGLTQAELDFFKSSFFLTYALAQVPSGWLSDRFGARLMLPIYILVWSFFNYMLGAVAGVFSLLVIMRFGMGLGQAGAYPTSGSVLSKWIPFSGRGGASSLVAVGGRIGLVIAPLLTAFLIVSFVPIDEQRFPTAIGRDDLLPQGNVAEQIADNPNQSKTIAHLRGLLGDRLDGIDSEPEDPTQLLTSLNRLLDDRNLYSAAAYVDIDLPLEAKNLLAEAESTSSLPSARRRRLNRLLLERIFPSGIRKLYGRGWRRVMYVYGLAGIAVAGLYWLVVRNRPDEHPWCSETEQRKIAGGRPTGAPGPHGKPGRTKEMFARMLASRSMWCDCLMQLGGNIGWVFLGTHLPQYLDEVHRVPILTRGMMAAVPLIGGSAGMLLGGLFTDFLVPRIGLKWGRRLPLVVTKFIATGGYLACIAYGTLFEDSGLNSPWAFTLTFGIVSFSTGLANPANWAFKQDVGGRYVGSILGWPNMWGNGGAFMAPMIYGFVLGETATVADWNSVFMVCIGGMIFSGVCAFGIDATIPIAPPEEDDDETGEGEPAKRVE